MNTKALNILGVIPAREGSKRVPKKNFRQFAETTLVDIAIEQAMRSQFLTQIVLSSDSDDVLEIGSKYNNIALLKRPIEISCDLSPAIDYVRHALLKLENKEEPFDMVVILQPSSPFRLASDIDACIKMLINHPEADSCVSVVKVDHMVHPVKLKKLIGELLVPYVEDEAGRFASHDLFDIYVRNCAVYVTWRKNLETRTDVIGEKSIAHIMPDNTSVDINSMIDFEFAEFLFNKVNLLKGC